MIIGISGRMCVGKDTVGKFLEEKGLTLIALADPMKRFCAEIFGWDEETLWGPSKYREVQDKRYPRWTSELATRMRESKAPYEDMEYKLGPEYLTPRHALQQLGTEWGRSCHTNTWVDAAIRTACELLEYPHTVEYARTVGTEYFEDPCVYPPRKGVAITDVRFPNEVAAIEAAGGVVLRVHRPVLKIVSTHLSETALNRHTFKHNLINSGTLDDLRRSTHTWLETLTAAKVEV